VQEGRRQEAGGQKAYTDFAPFLTGELLPPRWSSLVITIIKCSNQDNIPQHDKFNGMTND
jgi:hypothetical protein